MKKIIFSIFSTVITVSLLIGASKKDIVDTAVEAGSFKTLVTAVKAADLVETLKGDGPFTVLLRPTKPLPIYQNAHSNLFSNPRIKISLLEF